MDHVVGQLPCAGPDPRDGQGWSLLRKLTSWCSYAKPHQLAMSEHYAMVYSPT